MFNLDNAIRIGRFVFSDIDLHVDEMGDCFTLEYDFDEMRYTVKDIDLIGITPDQTRVYIWGNYLFDFNARDFPEWAQAEIYECESGGAFPAAFLAQLCYEIENSDLFA